MKSTNENLSIENKNEKNHGSYKTPLPEIDNLVFAGAGGKGVAYLGAIKVLHERGILNKVKRIAGTSAGGITAFILGLGFSYEELCYLSDKTDYSKFKDPDATKLWRKIGLSNLQNIVDILNKFGIYDGDVFLQWARHISFIALGSPDATFEDLHNATKKNPGLKDIYFIAYNINKDCLQEFSYEKTPKIKIADALRATMSFPLAFKPHPIIFYEEINYFIDGGVTSNYPIHIFDREQYLRDDYKRTDYGDSNPCTLGFRIQDPKKLYDLIEHNIPHSLQETINKNSTKKFTFIDFLKRLIDANTAKERDDVKNKYSSNTIDLSSCGHSVLDFDLPPEERRKMAEEAYKTTNTHFENFRGDGVYFDSSEKKGSKRLEKRIDETVTYKRLLKLRLSLEVKKELYIQEGKYSPCSVDITSINNRLHDIANHPLFLKNPPDPVSRDLVLKLVNDIYKKRKDVDESLEKFKKLRDQRLKITKISETGKASELLLELIGKNGDINLLNLLEKIDVKSLMKAAIIGEDKIGKYNLITKAARYGHINIINRLINIESKHNITIMQNNVVSAKARNGGTALYYAAEYGHLDLVKLLYANGAEVDYCGPDKDSAFVVAARQSHENIVCLFLDLRYKHKDSQMQITKKDLQGKTAFHYMIENNMEIACKKYFYELNRHYLAGYKEFTSVQDNNGNTPLHIISEKNSVDIWDCAKSICCGWGISGKWKMRDVFNLNAKNNEGKVPLQIAVEKGNIDIAKRLLDAGAKPYNNKSAKEILDEAKHNYDINQGNVFYFDRTGDLIENYKNVENSKGKSNNVGSNNYTVCIFDNKEKNKI